VVPLVSSGKCWDNSLKEMVMASFHNTLSFVVSFCLVLCNLFIELIKCWQLSVKFKLFITEVC
jgi:hypothetical protein